MSAPRILGGVSVAAVISWALEGCAGTSCGSRTPSPHEETISVPAGDIAALGDTGEALSDEACDALCEDWLAGSYAELEVTGCATTGATPIAGTADTGAPVGEVELTCSFTGFQYCKGRLHAAVRSRAPRGRGLGAWFAAAAHDEGAAVVAFLALSRELEALGAPKDLVSRARAAAADEVRHARAMAAVARSLGAAPLPVVRAAPAPRGALAIALENATEGCARETFAALLASHQATAAAPALRPLFVALAADETRHAQWSWDLDAWLAGLLPPADRRRVDAARRAALAGLRVGPTPRALGLPSPAAGRRMARRLARGMAGASGTSLPPVTRRDHQRGIRPPPD